MGDLEQRFFEQSFDPGYWPGFRQHVEEPPTFGYVGGFISHSELWREAWEKGWDWVMICEDDAVAAPGLGLTWCDIWDITAAEICTLRQREVSWDILYVGRQ